MTDTLVINTENSTITESTQLYDLVPENDPILNEVMPEFDFSNPPLDPVTLASNLVETCRSMNGYGLSANQCGLRHRVFVMGAGNEYIACFNPKIIKTSPETVHMEEACLSFPALGLRITRPAGIEVEYQDYEGTVRTANFVGLSARCFLHELDHMNGIVYTSKAKPLALKRGMEKRQKIKGLIKRIEKSNQKMAKLNGDTN